MIFEHKTDYLSTCHFRLSNALLVAAPSLHAATALISRQSTYINGDSLLSLPFRIHVCTRIHPRDFRLLMVWRSFEVVLSDVCVWG